MRMTSVPLRTRKAGNRRPTNVSLASELIEEAKQLEINISQACEKGLAAEVKKAREDKWIEENWEAIQFWNDYVEKNGLPLAKYRMF
jgi:antitoxin CcdA